MSAPYGTFIKNTVKNNKPPTKALSYFILQFVIDAVATSSLVSVNTAKVFNSNLHPSFQELKNLDSSFTTLITTYYDSATQELYPSDWKDKKTVTTFWWFANQVNVTVEATPLNNDLIKDIQDEMIDLLCNNANIYTNNLDQGGAGLQLFLNPRQNIITENQIFMEGENPQRPNFITITLTIVSKIHLG